MFSKFFTVVVIPQKTSKVNKIKIPVRLFTLAIVFLIILIGVWGWVLQDYYNLKKNLINLSDTQTLFQKQENQIYEYSGRIGSIQSKLDRLKELNYKLRVLTSLETARKSKNSDQDFNRFRQSQVEISEKEKKQREKIEQIAAREGVLQVIASDYSAIKTDQEEEEQKFENLQQFFDIRQNYFSRIPNRWPVKGFLTVSFGYGSDPYTGQLRPHYAIDIATRPSSLVYAPADGIVVSLEEDDVLGNLLKIDHGMGITTWYGHLSSFETKEGDLVTQGHVIGKVGSTGQSTTPQLHYEVRFNGVPQNPVKYIHD